LDTRKDQFVTYSFLERGCRRWGKVTSNATETINGVFGEARSLPIVFLIEHLVKYQSEKYHEGYSQACKYVTENKNTTEYCRNIQSRHADEASKCTVEVVESNHPFYRARVQSAFNAPITRYLEVTINVNRRSSTCPCSYSDEMGISCPHVKALLLQLNQTTTWCSTRYEINNYKESYSGRIPSMVVAAKLSVDETIAPPDYRRPAGRPAKKRKERSFVKKTNVQRECQVCDVLCF
jgi:tRNA/tmRNA/rRNA uracil-C5-methylase (TrmA/RlmC/RlmD family)